MKNTSETTPSAQAHTPQPDSERLLRDLLAIIHGDGGHYTHMQGLQISCHDAEMVLADLKVRLDQAEYELQKMHERFDAQIDTPCTKETH